MFAPLAFVAAFVLVPSVDSTETHAHRLLLKIGEGVPEATTAALHERLGSRVLYDLPQIGWQVVEVDAERRDEVRVRYAEHPAVVRADLDRRRVAAHDPNDPYWPMWHMQAITADDAWDVERGRPEVQVAIMDTGIQTDHPDLAANVWTNAGEIAGNGVDDDGNGYVDDVYGYDWAYGDSDPSDVHGHGTACAGLVAAVQDNSIGVTGVAPRCQVVAIKVALDSGYFYDSAVVPGLIYCADMGFQVISMSFYCDEVTPAEKDAIAYCWANGVLPVASAGNSDSVLPYYPAAYEQTVAVAATDTSNQRTWFSNWGSWVDVAAPGLGLSTTTVGSGYTTNFAGTSGSAPLVAGLAGLLFSAAPTATNRQVRRALEDTCTALIQSPYGEYTNYGLIDCAAAVDRIVTGTRPPRPGRFLLASPRGGGREVEARGTGGGRGGPRVTLYGVGLQRANQVRVLLDGISQPILSQSRHFVKVPWPGASVDTMRPRVYELEINGAVAGSFEWRREAGALYVPSDATDVGNGDHYGNADFGGLVEDDGTLFEVSRRDDGTLYAVFLFRFVDVRRAQQLVFDFTRSYDECTGDVETIEVYDWDSFSYPYGDWVKISSATIPDENEATQRATLSSDVGHYVDAAGSLYLRVKVSGAGSGAGLYADALQLRVD